MYVTSHLNDIKYLQVRGYWSQGKNTWPSNMCRGQKTGQHKMSNYNAFVVCVAELFDTKKVLSDHGTNLHDV